MNERDKADLARRNNVDATTDDGSPVATGVGAVAGGAAGGIAGGMAAGAAMGGMTGPIGAAVGAVAGAVVGAMAGNEIGDSIDPVAEDRYWRDNYSKRPYASSGSYDDYGPAYGYGVDAFTRYPNRQYDEVEPELERDWTNKRGGSGLEWDRARHATRDAWDRVSDSVERAVPGDSDRDGK